MLQNARFPSKQVETMRDLTANELAIAVQLSRSQIARRAHSIPGHRTTKGGHHRFRACAALEKWFTKETEKRIKDWRKPKADVGSQRPCRDFLAFYSVERMERLSPVAARALLIAFDDTIAKLREKQRWLVREFKLDD